MLQHHDNNNFSLWIKLRRQNTTFLKQRSCYILFCKICYIMKLDFSAPKFAMCELTSFFSIRKQNISKDWLETPLHIIIILRIQF